MQNRILVSKPSVQTIKKGGAEEIFLLILSLLIARASILGGLAPFGTAFFASMLLLEGPLLLCLLGSMAGSLSIAIQHHDALSYLLIYLILYGVSLAMKKSKRRISKTGIIFIVIFSFFVVKGIWLWLSAALLYDVILALVDMIISVLSIYVFSSNISFFMRHQRRRILSNEEMICISVFVGILLVGIGEFQIAGISLRTTLSNLVVMIFAYVGGAAMGASIGMTFGLILSLGSGIDPYLIGNLGACGLLAGTFRELKRIGTAAGFIFANAILTLYINKSTNVIIPFQQIGIAALLFLFLPQSAILYLKQFVDGSLNRVWEQNYYIHRMRDLTVGRLKEFSEVFKQVASVFDRIADGRRRLSQEDISRLFDIAASRVCAQCALKQSCWKREFYSTYNNLFELLAVAENKGFVAREDIPEPLARKCMNIEALVNVLNDIFDLYRTNLRWQKKVDESRLLVGQQLSGVAQVISELATELNVDIRFKDDLEGTIKAELDKSGIRVKEVLVQESANGKVEVHIVKKTCGGKRECTRQIAKVITSVLGKKMSCEDGNCHSSGKAQCVLIFKEALMFQVMTGVSRKAMEGRDVCGDSYSFNKLKEGKYLLALSDGMGTGSRAAQESAATVSLLEHFYEAGFHQDIIFRTINSIMMLRSNEEIYSTVDLCLMDLIDGYGDFIKIGSASSYIKKGERIEAIRSGNLPIGIVDDMQAESIRRPLEDGAFIIMMTDGIADLIGAVEEQDDWMAGVLGEIKTQNPQEMADLIMEKAIEYGENEVKDDMTVMVTRIWGKGRI